ncbi:hypothetical protein PHYBOEH_007792 [Phytophthora boehmeriae]|uniref:PX domain-containing protein n=1 Tax=Phytophthora boehmeriae TaxID=109152 RepID=A0A8T1W3S6_9STRA|nr:hypothetical protein PHYBOEH_007792 [Phytophthora boehmeriae]
MVTTKGLPTTHKTTADLSTLQVTIGELRLTADGTWLYLLQVACGRGRWQVAKRYSEIRELFLELAKCLTDCTAKTQCTEHCHFLEGLEQDKFPKKHLVLTQHKLEARAGDLDTFFLKMAMRLNLCKPMELQTCRLRGCPILTLISNFFEVDAQTKTLDRADFSRSISLQREAQRHDQHFTKKRRGSMSVNSVGFTRRFSFAFTDRHSAVAALAQ